MPTDAEAVEDALKELKKSADVLDFHSKIHELDHFDTAESKDAMKKLESSFSNLPAMTINIANKKLPNVLIQD